MNNTFKRTKLHTDITDADTQWLKRSFKFGKSFDRLDLYCKTKSRKCVCWQ